MAEKINLMFLCEEVGCNRKYKLLTRLKDHMLSAHSRLPTESIEAVNIVRKDVSRLNKENDQKSRKRELEEKEAEIQRARKDAYNELVEEQKRVFDTECSVCLQADVDSLVDPCGHCFCSTCITQCLVCPICRSKVRKVIKMFRP